MRKTFKQFFIGLLGLTFLCSIGLNLYTYRHPIKILLHQWIGYPSPPENPYHESTLAHEILDGLRGIEIGGTSYSPFGLNTLNVDFTDDLATPWKQEEIKLCGHCSKVDLVASGDQLPFKDGTWDFVLTSHVIEHFYDPIHTIQEWLRVVKVGGYVYMIVPHKERTFDRERPCSTPEELVDRHEHPHPPVLDDHRHYSVWTTQLFLALCEKMHWNVVAVQDADDHRGDGFTVVLQKIQ